MRALLFSLAASLAAATAITPNADACFNAIQPEVLGVSDHFGRGAFVVLDAPAPASVQWRQLWPHSYDSTSIADAPALVAPVEVVLIGTSGTRSIKTSRVVYLRPAWGFDGKAHLALEVDLAKGERLMNARLAGRMLM